MAMESVDVHVKFGDSRSNGSSDIRAADFVSNERTNDHDRLSGVSPNNNNNNILKLLSDYGFIDKVITTIVIRPLDNCTHMLCSICVHSFEALAKAVQMFIASLDRRPMRSLMCSIDISIDLQPVG